MAMKGQILKGERPGVGFGPEAWRMGVRGVRVGWRGVALLELGVLETVERSMGGKEGESVESRCWF